MIIVRFLIYFAIMGLIIMAPVIYYNIKVFFLYDRDGYDSDGYDSDGYDRNGYDKYGYNRNGYNIAGYNREGYNLDGYDKEGYNQYGYDKDGYNRDGYNKHGYNKEGYNLDGYDKEGYNQYGYNKHGFNRAGYDRDGYDKSGFNMFGYNRAGYDKNGFNEEGYNDHGFDKRGYDRNAQVSPYFDAIYKNTRNTDRNENFDIIQIGIHSPEKIRGWSHGEVKESKTVEYSTLEPKCDGLFCEKIFGPRKDWECRCGKYKGVHYKGIICDRCGVEITQSHVRHERMGHIELAAPVSHIWYSDGIASCMSLLLDMTPGTLENVLYFKSYIVINPGSCTELEKKQILSEWEYRECIEKYGYNFRVGMGAEAIKELLAEINLEELSAEIRERLKDATGLKKFHLEKRLKVVESFISSGSNPAWMILDAIPVIPPNIRPVVRLNDGKIVVSDLNYLYQHVIDRNNSLKRYLERESPEIILRNEKKMLQEAVDALIYNGRHGRPVKRYGDRPLESISDMLRNDPGLFRVLADATVIKENAVLGIYENATEIDDDFDNFDVSNDEEDLFEDNFDDFDFFDDELDLL